MTRVARYKLGYVLVFLLLAAGLVLLHTRYEPGRWMIVAVVVVLLVPGRIQGLLFRDHFRGRRDLDRQDPAAALAHFNAFLATVQAQPWRKLVLWLSWSFYTPSVEAMTWNNIGAAQMGLGDKAAAEAAWSEALALDPKYPVPHANLALIAATRGDQVAAERHLEKARALGYSGEAFDRFVHKTQSILATVESAGPKA